MRSKKLLVIVAALVACLAIGSATVATAKKKKTKKITTTISLAVTVTPAGPYAPYPQGSGTFSGKVKAKGPSGCRKNRTVTISRAGSPIVGQVGTDPNGNYTLSIPAAPPAGTYTAFVPKKVIKKKNGKKTICKAATSPPVVVP